MRIFPVTRFLASVANADEAGIARAQGADIIDAKDPTTGALGALAPEIIRAIVAKIDGKCSVSAVAGDLPMEPEVIFAAAEALASTGVTYLKIGLFPSDKREACIRALAAMSASVKLIGVMFADHGVDGTLIPIMGQAGFAGAMIDTASKGDKRLLDHLNPSFLIGFVDSCHAHGLLAGLAGSLELPDIPRLLLVSPDFLGFRGALCGPRGRDSRIESEAVGRVRELIPVEDSRATGEIVASRVDFRLLAAQCFSNDPRKNGDATDRIFVHDFVLPVRVGAYAREREKPQRVCFNVDIDLKRLDHIPEDMRDVVSYDVVTDGIGMIVAAGHIALVETLAERVAALALAYPRVVRVTVRVEKLDIRPGSVGVEITRERPAESSGVRRLFPGPVGRSEPKRAS